MKKIKLWLDDNVAPYFLDALCFLVGSLGGLVFFMLCWPDGVY